MSYALAGIRPRASAMRKHAHRTVSAVAIIIAAQLTLLTPTPATAAPTGVRVLQLNICHSGKAPCFKGGAVMARAAEIIAQAKPHVLSVNEACSADIKPLIAAMDSALGNPGVHPHFVPARDESDPGKPKDRNCENGTPYGNLILLSKEFGEQASPSGSAFTDPDPHDKQPYQDGKTSERRSYACLNASKLIACSAHLSSDNQDVALRQCKVALDVVRQAGKPGVFAGDTNLRKRGKNSKDADVQDCVPSGFTRKGDGSVQHIFFANSLKFADSEKISMKSTSDHPAFLVKLQLP